MRLVLLAAGASRRMGGRDKLMEEVDGEPLLRRQVRAALAAGVGPVAVTLPTDRPLRGLALQGLAVTRLTITDAAEGMAASLRAAAVWAEGEALMIAPADMPDLTAADFSAMADAFDGEAPLRACAQDGTPGHPVVFPAALLAGFADLCGDEGARAVLRSHPPRNLALPAQHAVTDLDTAQDWADWRATRGLDADQGNR